MAARRCSVILDPVSPDDRRAAWAHLRRLAAEHRVKLHATQARWDSEAHMGTRQAFVPRQLRAPVDYLVALHEIGHIVSPLARRLIGNRQYQHEVAAEAAAWAWAVEHAEPAVLALAGERDWELVGEAMTSHLRPQPAS